MTIYVPSGSHLRGARILSDSVALQHCQAGDISLVAYPGIRENVYTSERQTQAFCTNGKWNDFS
jgi:hypothetical protein